MNVPERDKCAASSQIYFERTTMSYQYELSGTVELTPTGVAIVSLLHETRKAEHPDTEVSTWLIVAQTYPEVEEFGQNDRSDFIPYGAYGDLDPESTLRGSTWEIQCSTKNAGDEIEAFMKMLPRIATACDLEVENDDGGITTWKFLEDAVVPTAVRRRNTGSWGGYGYGG
jgi:hypothetical protein